jgi:hypothetical protein
LEKKIEVTEYDDAIVIVQGEINPKLFVQSLREILAKRESNSLKKKIDDFLDRQKGESTEKNKTK